MGNDWDDFKSGYDKGSGTGSCLGAIVVMLFTGAFSLMTALFTGILTMNQVEVEDKIRQAKRLPSNGTLSVAVTCSCSAVNETGRVYCLNCGNPLVTEDNIHLGNGVGPVVIAFGVWVAFMLVGFVIASSGGLGYLIGSIWILAFIGIGVRLLITRFL